VRDSTVRHNTMVNTSLGSTLPPVFVLQCLTGKADKNKQNNHSIQIQTKTVDSCGKKSGSAAHTRERNYAARQFMVHGVSTFWGL